MNYVLIKQHNTAENMTLQVSLKELNNLSQERNKSHNMENPLLVGTASNNE